MVLFCNIYSVKLYLADNENLNSNGIATISQLRVYNTVDALTLISNKGIFRYSNAIVRTVPSIVVKSYAPSANSKAQAVGDMWYNTYKMELYIAKAVTDSATTWEKQYSANEIADLADRITALENK